MTAGVVLADAVGSGLLGIAALQPNNVPLEKQVNLIVTYVNVLVLLGKWSLSFETSVITRPSLQ